MLPLPVALLSTLLSPAVLLGALSPGPAPSALSPLFALAADEGTPSAGQTPGDALAAYKCDKTTCVLPNCRCASTDIPGDLKPEQTPMFIVFTADDAIQSYTINAVNQFLAHRRNPNNCTMKMTYFTQLSYTNYSLVTDWFAAGNEIADHTMTHPELPGDPQMETEVSGNLMALNQLAGIPLSSIQGFRAPYLNYSAELLTTLARTGFTYDSSATASAPVGAANSDAFWPYTLDHGLVNDCLTFPDICYGKPELPGFWEIPMYALFDDTGPNGIHLMDPWLDNPSLNFTLKFMQDTFTAHYNGNRQPFGLYTHPIHVATGYPGVPDPVDMIRMINTFLDWAMQHDNVWIVSNEQLLAWVRNPTSIADLNNFAPLKCPQPDLPADLKICNGLPQHETGLLQRCPFNDFPFFTCYGCPTEPPSLDNPSPPQAAVPGSEPRFRLPANCSTVFWDPIAGQCHCSGSNCTFTDVSRPIGVNGTGYIGGQTPTVGASSSASASPTAFVPFSSAPGPSLAHLAPGLLTLGALTLGGLATLAAFTR